MYQLKNGILHRANRKIFALGQSYYPSFHPQKHPVPPDQDRVGEMKKDFADMAAAGFELVRLAAIGRVSRDNGKIVVDFPLPDQLCAEAEKAGLAAIVRLQGYSYDLPDSREIIMWNEHDETMPFQWGWFVRHCLNHPAVIRDECDATEACAAHFDAFDNVVGFQIYNEPAYPSKGLYDYHPASIAAWRKWLVETGRKPAEAAARMEPPRRYPERDQDPSDWISWRLFHLQRLNDYLNLLAAEAKAVSPAREVMTCCMPCPLMPGNSLRGEDYFRLAEKMDLVGITLYFATCGAYYYYTSEILALAESAAALYGKHAWLMEYNAGVGLTGFAWERDAYTAAGAGIKGILYYQWRADYAYPDSPEPGIFGMLRSDRSRTEKFDRAVAMTRLLRELSDCLVNAEKFRSGVAVLFSENVNAWCDAVENTDPERKQDDVSYTNLESNTERTFRCWRDFARAGISPDFVRTCDLEDNKLNIRLLIVPQEAGLSDEEKQQLAAFRKRGGRVATLEHVCVDAGYALPDTPTDDEWGAYRSNLEAEHLLLRTGIEPLFRAEAPFLDVKVLAGDGYFLLSLINHDLFERTIPAGSALELPFCRRAVKEAWFFVPGRKEPVPFCNEKTGCRLTLPGISSGGFLLLQW